MSTSLFLTDAARAALDKRAEPVASHGGTRITGRHNLSAPASDIIERYDALMAYGLGCLARTLKGLDGGAMFACACDALNGTRTEAWSVNLAGSCVAEAILEDGLGEKWELPENAATIFENLDTIECFALADLVERYWRGVARGDASSPVEFWQVL